MKSMGGRCLAIRAPAAPPELTHPPRAGQLSLASAVLALQRSAGNKATAKLIESACQAPVVQRQTSDPPELLSPELASSPRCQKAYSTPGKHMRRGETSEGVEALQAALVKVGFGIPFNKTMNSGDPDGVYGKETVKSVRAFQSRKKVPFPTGLEAGHKTLRQLDLALGAGETPEPAPGPTSAVVLPTNLHGVQEPGSATDKGRVVTKPETQVRTASTETHEDDDDDKLKGEVTVDVGGKIDWNTAGDPPEHLEPPKHDLDPLCEHGTMQLSGQLTIPWARNRGRTVKLFPEIALQIDFAPTLCGRSPSLSMQANAMKVIVAKGVEVSLNSALGLQGPPTGWIFQLSPELSVHPFRSGVFKDFGISIGAVGGVLFIPGAGNQKGFITGQGGLDLGLQYQF